MTERYGLTLVTGPASEPVSLQEVKDHLRVTATDEDTYISALITAARRYCEGIQNRAYITQTWDMTLDTWPEEDYLQLPRAPLASITSVTYIDSDGATNTMTASDYFADTKQEPGRICLSYGESWPTATLRPYAAITIRFVAGSASAQENTKHLIKMLVAHWYENREAITVGRDEPKQVPLAFESLLLMDRVY